jgi:UDP-2-acetamido-3-amino-2,3-dideoxy-glucuronate N-acetyltransferase
VTAADAIVHPTAECSSTARIGARCSIAEHATIGDDVVLDEDVQVGPGARLIRGVTVGPGGVIGANAVLTAVAVGRGAVVQPGATVTASVPPNAVVAGNPASIVGYVTDEPVTPEGAPPPRRPAREHPVEPTAVPGVELYALTRTADLRGSLMAAEFDMLPFAPRRVFTVLEVPSEAVRGSHAHRTCAQFLVCLSGSVRCLIDNGVARDEVLLDGPDVGLHMPPMIWGTQYKYTNDAVLLVLASHPYEAEDYIRSYDEFLEAVGQLSPDSASQARTTSSG